MTPWITTKANKLHATKVGNSTLVQYPEDNT